MNYRGSYRHLLKNGKAALLAAIEIYNKPRFDYREECCVILLLNAWELILKALLSKNGRSIFYRKQRGQPYRTLSWRDALMSARELFPKDFPFVPIAKNLELLATYRDNAVHFYNQGDFRIVLYALAQTSIVNLKDLLQRAFQVDLGTEITWQLLPLGLRPPVDAIEYLSGFAAQQRPLPRAVDQFIKDLASAVAEVEKAGADTGRLLTVFSVKLESVKKIQNADVVVGVTTPSEGQEAAAILKPVDPNITHPLRQTEVLQQIPTLHGRRFTGFIFQAIVWKYGLKTKRQYCWQAKEGVLTRYSYDVLAFTKTLSVGEVEAALVEYKAFLKQRRNSRRKKGGA